MKLLDVVKQRTEKATQLNSTQLKALMNEDGSVLHDPFLYQGMTKLVELLHDFHQKQQDDPSQLLIVDTDYDTDGIMAATVMSAGLSLLGFDYRIYTPSMSDGYGLSPAAVDKMEKMFADNDHHLGLILTADNGTNAIQGVEYAQDKGIEVLVTDHHLTTDQNAPASVIVNSNQTGKEEETYPFKGNAGACVIWKALLAYSESYQPDMYDLIYDLIVFAGISNVSDVMPIVDENHFIVKSAVKEIQRLFDIRENYKGKTNVYHLVKDTGYPAYDAVFHGLYDLLDGLQTSKDKKRAKQGKKPYPLPHDEELIGWYLAPLLNAPRRVHSTCQESMIALISTNPKVRKLNIQKLLDMNQTKTDLRDQVLDQLDLSSFSKKAGITLFVNAPHGISGLIAGQVAQKTNRAAIVFAMPTDSKDMVYSDHQFDNYQDKDDLLIGSSARSNAMQPLNVIMNKVNELSPGIVASGGGHALAAGYTIHYKDLEKFTELFNQVAAQVEQDLIKEQHDAIKNGRIKHTYSNVVRLNFYNNDSEYDYQNYNLNSATDLYNQLLDVYYFEQQLKPFGKDFSGQTVFELEIEPKRLATQKEFNYNPNFWKTFKFTLCGVDCITFDTDLAKLVKDRISEHNSAKIIAHAKLTLNTFRGNTSPQLQLSLD